MEWVVRAGMAEPGNLQANYQEHDAVPGVFGFSVQYQAGRTIDELAQAGQFPNAKISYAYDGELAATLSPLGYSMRLVATPGRGYHHTFMVLYDASGAMLLDLPDAAAQALSSAFRRTDNPHRVKHGHKPGRKIP